MSHLCFLKVGDREPPLKGGYLSLLGNCWPHHIKGWPNYGLFLWPWSCYRRSCLFPPLSNLTNTSSQWWLCFSLGLLLCPRLLLPWCWDCHYLPFRRRDDCNDWVVILYYVILLWICFEFHIKVDPSFSLCEVIPDPHFAWSTFNISPSVTLKCNELVLIFLSTVNIEPKHEALSLSRAPLHYLHELE